MAPRVYRKKKKRERRRCGEVEKGSETDKDKRKTKGPRNQQAGTKRVRKQKRQGIQ